MTKTTDEQLLEILNAVAGYYYKTITPTTFALWNSALKPYPVQVIRECFNRHIQTQKFMPTIAEIMDQLRHLDGRPKAEEAWSIVAVAMDNEAITIVWTEEIAAAYRVASACLPDRVAARMAFKETYNAQVDAARHQGIPPKWSPSLGTDLFGRQGPLEEAVRLGRLTHQQAHPLIPPTTSTTAPVIPLPTNLINHTHK